MRAREKPDALRPERRAPPWTIAFPTTWAVRRGARVRRVVPHRFAKVKQDGSPRLLRRASVQEG